MAGGWTWGCKPTCRMVSKPKCWPCHSVNSPALVPVRHLRPSVVHVMALMLARTCLTTNACSQGVVRTLGLGT